MALHKAARNTIMWYRFLDARVGWGSAKGCAVQAVVGIPLGASSLRSTCLRLVVGRVSECWRCCNTATCS